MGRVFDNGLGDPGSIPGRVIPKTLKIVLDTSLLNTQQYKVCIEGKEEQSRESSIPSPTPRCSSYQNGSLLVTLDYGRQLYFFFFYLTHRWDPDNTLGQSEPRRNGNDQYSKLPRTGTSSSDGLVLYPEHLLGEWGSHPHCRDAVGVFYSPSH